MTTDLSMLRVIDQNTGEQVVIDLSSTGEIMVEDVTIAPPADIFVITPSNTEDLEHATRGIYVGIAGNITLTTVNGKTGMLANVAAGSILPIQAIRVFVTGTSATNLVGVY